MVIVISSIILSIAAVQGIIMAFMIRRQKKKRNLQEIDFRIFFIMGIIWIPLSIILGAVSFVLQIPFYIAFPAFIIGFVYLLLGLKKSTLTGGA